ncbi:40S ribosomal protein S5-1 [Hordeum vulgare]|nr:40S ribosomal protein S5-1 [Hordeum vulgare]
MTPSSSSKDKFYEKVINPYLLEVMKHPQTIDLREGMIHILDVQGAKKEGSEKVRLVAMEQEIFKCEGMVEHGLSTNHSMVMNFIPDNKKDMKEILDMIFKLHDRLQDLQAQIYDLQNQNSPFPTKAESSSPPVMSSPSLWCLFHTLELGFELLEPPGV